tara:strand:+ start:3052 stop:3378 length:327 start_codon:yes stop_codon:yes gene_type:complete
MVVAAALLLAAGPATANFSKAFDLYNAGKFEKARNLAQPDAHRGNPAAQWLVGTMYLLGEGIEANPVAARVWLAKSAASNYPPAQAVLGLMYEQGIAAAAATDGASAG